MKYYGEILQAFWSPKDKVWRTRYKTARVIFDSFNALVMKDCVLRGYANKVPGHPDAIIEGRIEEKALTEEIKTSITVEMTSPPIFRWDNKEVLTPSKKIDTVWLEPDGSINGMGLRDVPVVTKHRNQHNRFATRWMCEWRRNGTLVKSEEVTAIHQWNAVRYLLRLKAANRRQGSMAGDVLTYEDSRGNMVIVRPVTTT